MPAVPSLNSPVTTLAGVGPGLEGRLQNLGVRTILDVLLHLPFRYVDRTRLVSINSLLPGQEVCVEGRVEQTQIRFGGKRSLICVLRDETGLLTLRFFHFSQSQRTALKEGTRLRCWGQIRAGKNAPEMIHPEYQYISETEHSALEQTLTPIYPATEGLAQTRLRKLAKQALAVLERNPEVLEELLPESVSAKGRFPLLAESLRYLHNPPADADLGLLGSGMHPAQQRLAFEELLAHQISLRLLRQQIRQANAFELLQGNDRLVTRFMKNLPYKLTAAQTRVLEEINQDLDRNVPMLRLVQGDVGSGKTVVAALSAIRVINAGYQVALMAPTELLADQHYYNLHQWLDKLGIPVILLTGKLKPAARRQANEQIMSGQALLVVGTHALFQESTGFGRLGLVIIDEQHRFGVGQRLALLEKGNDGERRPHQLVMTATPIPRTLAMSLFAELDVSTIDELPPGRQQVNTVVLSNQKRDEITERITRVCNEGHQVYWVCPLIEESDALQCQAAVNTFEYLSEMLPQLSIGLIHGRMRSQEKEAVMQSFKAGAINLLVATTVIEVGVDVPNANLMVIENPERMGLAQLHQLRGRVGRGKAKSVCVLLYQSPLTELAQTRLEVMRNHTDGFIIAEKDLELRGPGDMLGTRQTGLPQMRIASLIRDARLLPAIRRIADRMINENPLQAEKLMARWLSNRTGYGNV
jgi:ATP-dependent DNA helicase RecG